jgi:hypothetical protein
VHRQETATPGATDRGRQLEADRLERRDAADAGGRTHPEKRGGRAACQ